MNGAGRYLTDMFHAAFRDLKRSRPHLELNLRWVPGHSDIPGNEAADVAAQDAVHKHSSDTRQLPKSLRKSLPLIATRARQNFKSWSVGRVCGGALPGGFTLSPPYVCWTTSRS